ncbi:cytochrome b5, partial [Myxozyma melibiosi]
SGETPVYVPFLNALLIFVCVYLVYRTIFPSLASDHDHVRAKEAALTRSEPIVFSTFTPKTLAPHNGTDQPRVLMGIRGRVYDVSAGRNFYGPGGPYSNFAGRDASRGLAKGSFEEDMLTDIDKPLDKLEDLMPEEINALNDWESHFRGKYILCGELIEN